MKILLVNKFHYRRGGSETYYFALADALKKAGHEVVFFAMKHEENFPCEQEEFFVDNVDYKGENSKLSELKMAVKLIYSFEAKNKFEALVKKEKPDVVHINLVHRQITLSILDVCKKYKIPVVFTAHDLVCTCSIGSLLTPERKECRECYGGKFLNCIRKRCMSGSLTKSVAACAEAYFYKLHGSYNKIDYYITPSAFHKNEILKAGITRNTVENIPNFLPPETAFEIKEKKENYFLFLGSLSEDKGVFTLLKAFHKADIEGFRLVIAGTGYESDRMKKYIAENSLEDKVEMTGFVTGERLEKLRDNAYAVVLPSECFENGPYALMEPMSAGKPVIGAEIGGIPEMAIPHKTGWLFESGNEECLAEILKKATEISDEEYKNLSQKACEFAEARFNHENYIRKLEKIYENLIGEKAI